MLLVHDRKLLTHLDTSQIAKATATAKLVKVAICIFLAVAFICAEFAASVELIQSGADVELTP
jgi:hypothetical protein